VCAVSCSRITGSEYDTRCQAGFFQSVVPDDGDKPPDMDISVAYQARVYDYLLGGCFL
jgi:hypothetical protein